jgi:hypothetical protein
VPKKKRARVFPARLHSRSLEICAEVRYQVTTIDPAAFPHLRWCQLPECNPLVSRPKWDIESRGAFGSAGDPPWLTSGVPLQTLATGCLLQIKSRESYPFWNWVAHL